MAKGRLGGFEGIAPIIAGIIFFLAAVLLAAAWFPPPARAQALELLGPEKKEVVANEYGRIWVGLGYLTGDVTYQIGGKVRGTFGGQITQYKSNFPLSELKWPLDALMWTVGGELRFFKKGELRVAFSKNLTDSPGKLADTDWEDPSAPQTKTTFGYCDTMFPDMSSI